MKQNLNKSYIFKFGFNLKSSASRDTILQYAQAPLTV
jgi:hypothetical protein